MQYQCQKCGWSGEVNGRPRCLPCDANRVREWRQKNPEKRKQQKARWLIRRILSEPEYLQNRSRKKRINNPETYRAKYERRKQWLIEGTVTSEELQRIWQRDGGKCRYCGSSEIRPRFNPKDPRGFDHVIARANGGKHEALNIVVCCKNCNIAKGDR